MGMLCCHAIRVISHMGIREIPQRHILTRWTRAACRVLPEHLRMYQKESPAMLSTSFRHTALYRTALELVQLADSNTESFEVAMGMMLDAMPKLAETSIIKDGLGSEQKMHASTPPAARTNMILEPNHDECPGSILRTDIIAPLKRKDLGRTTAARARPGYEIGVKRTRFCGVCRRSGHNAAGCPTVERKTKKSRKEPRCSNCGILGHTKTSCANWFGRHRVS
uniref:Uncharacterized protein n=1 Tax=Avena sativa TaxID=4498 RepID=A0ACD5TNI0_AVESA